MKIYNPFPRLTKQEGEAKLEAWAEAYGDAKYNGLVYHYTSIAALAGILKSGALFCTDYRQLNDTTELRLGLEVLESAIAARGAKFGATEECVTEMLDHIALLRRANFHISMFCGSFSLRGNDLTQWRAYAPSNGVSIGFSEPLLSQLARDQHFVCGAVRYLGAPLFSEWIDKQLICMREGWKEMAQNEIEIRKHYEGQPQEHADLDISFQRSGNNERWIGEVSGFLKSADFRSEQEWRCVYVLRENTQQRRLPIKFRDWSTQVRRYVELDIAAVGLENLIQEIIIGPGTGNDDPLGLVSDLCRSANLAAPIKRPFHSYCPGTR